MTTIAVTRTCRVCGQTNSRAVDSRAYEAWKAGALIQDAFPAMSATDRELLISGTCDPCFHILFSDDEENSGS